MMNSPSQSWRNIFQESDINNKESQLVNSYCEVPQPGNNYTVAIDERVSI